MDASTTNSLDNLAIALPVIEGPNDNLHAYDRQSGWVWQQIAPCFWVSGWWVLSRNPQVLTEGWTLTRNGHKVLDGIILFSAALDLAPSIQNLLDAS